MILKYAPNPSMEGTQIPTKRPASVLPLNHKPIDKTMEIKAAIRMKESDVFNIVQDFFRESKRHK